MKKLMIISALAFSLFMVKTADAQIKVNVNINTQPEWGPSGYNHVDYYYLPDIDVYYNVASHQYTYFNGKKWNTIGNLPANYRNYDLYRGYKVVINRSNPWSNNKYDRENYKTYQHNYKQENLRDHKNSNANVQKNSKDKFAKNERDERGKNEAVSHRPQRKG